jgi:aminoglycoside phosphotransferase (APT) family kinase protein
MTSYDPSLPDTAISMTKLSLDQIALLLKAHGLTLETWEEPRQGMINQTLIINQNYVLRIDAFMPDTIPSRYLGEARAYAKLHEARLPVPRVIALDVSRTLVPLPYMLISRLPGTPLIYLWETLTPEQRITAASQAGSLMARMHEVPMEAYGWLSNLDTKPLSSALELTETFFYWHLNIAERQNTFSPDLRARLIRLWERVKPFVAEVKRPYLIHRDFQFENVLVVGDQVTGLIDFEWGAVGDPAWDFMVDRQREDQCPGSMSHFYTGYQSRRPLPAHLPILSLFYLFLLEMDLTITIIPSQGDHSDSSRRKMIAALEELEAELF